MFSYYLFSYLSSFAMFVLPLPPDGVAVGGCREAGLTQGDLCSSGRVLTYWRTFFKSAYEKVTKTRTWVHLEGISCENTIHTNLFKRIKAVSYVVENKTRSCFSAPFLGYQYSERRWGGLH